MEKKLYLRTNQVPAKALNSDSRKSVQDPSGKQVPRNSRRREFSQNSNHSQRNDRVSNNFNSGNRQPSFVPKSRGHYNNNNNNNGNNNNNNTNSTGSENGNEKRFRNDGYQRSVSATSAGTRLDECDEDHDDHGGFEAELNSVYLPGSKKQNLNHLLNFNYAPRERNDPLLYVRSGNINKNNMYMKRVKYNKEQYLQANCQFVVKFGGDYAQYSFSPDLLVDWSSIEQIHFFGSTEEPQCPICLYHPVAAKMTRCGHVYCWPCILHYLALSDKKSWRKCPICFEAVHIGDLKSAVSKPHRHYAIGDFVTLELMCRKKDSLQSYKVKNYNFDRFLEKKSSVFPSLTDDLDKTVHSKLLLATPNEIMSIIERERNELKCQLTSDGIDCPDSLFVQQALCLLEEREQLVRGELEAGIAQVTEIMEKLELNLDVDELTPDTNNLEATSSIGDDSESLHENFVIDEESELTVNDIDIVPTSSSKHSADHFFFYQSDDGQHLYLHSFNVRMLQVMYDSLENAPHVITGKIVQKEVCSMNEALRKRLKYLQQLPVSCQFEVVEIALEPPIVSVDIMKCFRDEICVRQKNRQRRAREERKREKHIDRVNEQQLGKFMRATVNIDVTSDQQFPMCGSFEDPPLQSPSFSNEVLSSPGKSAIYSGPSFAKMLTSAKTIQAELWPTLGTPKDVPGFSTTDFMPLQARSKKSTVHGPFCQSENNHKFSYEHSDDESIDYESCAPPEFKSSFGSAIAEALNNASAHDKTPKNEGNGGTKAGRNKKKKNVGKTLLFSTGCRTFDGN